MLENGGAFAWKMGSMYPLKKGGLGAFRSACSSSEGKLEEENGSMNPNGKLPKIT